jgi:ankyrin repeat protein
MHKGAAAMRLAGAAGDGDLEMLKFLLDSGADITAQDFHGTPLRWACVRGQFEVVQEGHDVNLCEGNGNSPLLAAAYTGHAEIVSFLVANGAVLEGSPTQALVAEFAGLGTSFPFRKALETLKAAGAKHALEVLQAIADVWLRRRHSF